MTGAAAVRGKGSIEGASLLPRLGGLHRAASRGMQSAAHEQRASQQGDATRMTDREAMSAVFIAVSALAEKLTGKRLTVFVETEGGMIAVSSADAPWKFSDPAE